MKKQAVVRPLLALLILPTLSCNSRPTLTQERAVNDVREWICDAERALCPDSISQGQLRIRVGDKDVRYVDLNGSHVATYRWIDKRWVFVPAENLRAEVASYQLEDRAAASVVKSDLGHLAAAQEAYFADHLTYTKHISELNWRATDGVSIDVLMADRNGWIATGKKLRARCLLFYGSDDATVRRAFSLLIEEYQAPEGVIACRFDRD